MASRAGHLSTLPVRFDSKVELKILDARLSLAGLLQCDPIARVELVTTRRRVVESDVPDRPPIPNFSFDREKLGQTKQCIFTSSPLFNDDFTFTLQEKKSTMCSSTRDDQTEVNLVITVEDSTTCKFLGQACCPFSPYSPSMSSEDSPVRLMLQPRNAVDASDPLFAEDTETLRDALLDDFGFICIMWKVTVIPTGGCAFPAASSPSMFPIGFTVRASWLVQEPTDRQSVRYTTTAEFGDGKRFALSEGKPLFLTLHSAPASQSIVFNCGIHNSSHLDASNEISVPLPLTPLDLQMLDRDVHWSAAVRSSSGADFGLLLVTIRLSKRVLDGNMPECLTAACPLINDPAHQEEFSHKAADFSKEPPRTPSGAYHALFWESQEHIHLAVERQRQRDVVVAAQPTAEHVRHLFDVLMGRSTLDDGVAQVAANFFQCATTNLAAAQLKQLMVAFAFQSKNLSVLAAARFLFIAFRSDTPDAVSFGEVLYMLQHCLLPQTVDMPEKELQRWATDIFGKSTTSVSYTDFCSYALHNYSMWYAFGVPLSIDCATCSEGLPHLDLMRSSHSLSPLVPSALVSRTNEERQQHLTHPAQRGKCNDGRPHSAGRNVQFQLDPVDSSAPSWRTFIVRVSSTGASFSVTAHCRDTVRDAMKMVEDSTGIKAECQQWKVNGESVLDGSVTIGNSVLGVESSMKDGQHRPGSAGAGAAEVWVYEVDENILLNFYYKDKNKRWQQNVPTKEKVLRIRAGVQQKTLIPLSRCSMRLISGDRRLVLQDRHMLSFYSPQPQDFIEITQD